MKIEVNEEDFVRRVYELERLDSNETFKKLEKNKSFRNVAEFLIKRTLHELYIK